MLIASLYVGCFAHLIDHPTNHLTDHSTVACDRILRSYLAITIVIRDRREHKREYKREHGREHEAKA